MQMRMARKHIARIQTAQKAKRSTISCKTKENSEKNV